MMPSAWFDALARFGSLRYINYLLGRNRYSMNPESDT